MQKKIDISVITPVTENLVANKYQHKSQKFAKMIQQINSENIARAFKFINRYFPI